MAPTANPIEFQNNFQILLYDEHKGLKAVYAGKAGWRSGPI
jgi:hypothetical protein